MGVRILGTLSLLIVAIASCLGNCDPFFAEPLSNRMANYQIDCVLDHNAKKVDATQSILWVNPSPDTIHELRFYMYMNAFKNAQSSYLDGVNLRAFGLNLEERKPEEWGYIEVTKCIRNGKSILNRAKYIQPNDGNEMDESVLSIPLEEAILPYDTLRLDMAFVTKLPRTIVRSGYSRGNFFLFVHWFPQLGVFEKNRQGEWDWNCHQFLRNTEFYADFGNYEVSMTTAEELVVGASGCQIDEVKLDAGFTKRTFHIEDVIDFAWTAYPRFEVIEDTWEHVDIKLLIAPEHKSLSKRLIRALKHALGYLTDHVGEYPYPTITVMNPPLHGLRSGMMEYPTFITCGSFYNMPGGVRTLESLLIHEFAHQYFMGILASNEKEEAWMDEGFVTYFEDAIMEDMMGNEKSLIDIFGIEIDNGEFTRLEYSGLDNPGSGIIDQPGWEIKSHYKELVYSKTATVLATLKGIIGEGRMDKLIKSYFEAYKFTHPKGQEFIDHACGLFQKDLMEEMDFDLRHYFEQTLRRSDICQYSVVSVSSNRVGDTSYSADKEVIRSSVSHEGELKYLNRFTIQRKGEISVPQEIRLTFSNGKSEWIKWSGKEELKEYKILASDELVSIELDPERKILLDLNMNDNSITLRQSKSAIVKLGAKAIFWIQNILQASSFLI